MAPEVNEPALAGSTEHPTLLPPRRHPWPPWAMPTAATLAVATLGTLLWITSHPYVTPVGESFLTKLESANQLAVSSCDGILANFRGPFDPSDEMIASQSNCRGGDNETELTPAALTDALNNAIAELERDEKPALGDVLAAARFCLHPEVRLPASAASLTCRNLERWSSNEELQNLCTWATFRSAGSGDKGQETKREAAARMASLVEKHPKDLSFAFNLASMLTELKDPGAIEAWDRYLELDSSSAWAAEAMKKRAGLEANPTQ